MRFNIFAFSGEVKVYQFLPSHHPTQAGTAGGERKWLSCKSVPPEEPGFHQLVRRSVSAETSNPALQCSPVVLGLLVMMEMFITVIVIMISALYGHCVLSCFCHVQLFATPWIVAHRAPLSMEFCRQEHWSGLPFPSPGDLPNSGIELRSPILQADSLPSEPQEKLRIENTEEIYQYIGKIAGWKEW